MDNTQLPVGIFDSGLGGLTVVREVQRILPEESIIYFGDTARVPYGTKSNETVQKFSREITNFLIEKRVKAVVIACNTASAVALHDLRNRYNLPILGVVNPGARAAISVTLNNIVGAIGTTSTIVSDAYAKTINELNSDIQVYSQACPLLVPLVEEGWLNHSITKQVLEVYLRPLVEKKMDSIILGCTHYPLLKQTIKRVLPNTIRIVDSAEVVALDLKEMLTNKKLRNQTVVPQYQYFLTDLPKQFQKIGERFLGAPIDPLEIVSLEK